jgi:plastocyanin
MRRYPVIFLALAAILAGCGDEAAGGSPADAVAPAEAGAPSAPAGTAPTPDAAAKGPEAGPPDAGMAGPTDTRITVTVPADAAMAAADTASPDAPPPEPGTMVIGSAGGTLMINEGKLFIRPGALAANTSIVFRTVNSGYPALPGNRAYSSVVSLEPHGTNFAAPVDLTLYHFGGAAKVALYTASPGGAFTRVENATITVNTADATLAHFSYFVVAPVVVPPDAGPDVAPRLDTAPDLPPPDTGPDVAADTAPPGDVAPPPDVATPDAAPDAAADVAPDLAPPRLDSGPSNFFVSVKGEYAGFVPRIVEIAAGDAVVWTWEADGIHSVISGGGGGPGDCASDGKFNSGVKSVGQTFSRTFTAAGMYPYHCAAHCTQFEGGVIVVK